MDKYLKKYMKAKFSFKDLKKAGVFTKDVKHNDYEKQAEIICKKFGFGNIYEYSKFTPVYFAYPQGIATGEFKNTFGKDVLNVLFSHQHPTNQSDRD